MKKRLLSLLLAIVMVVSVLPAALFAADETAVSFNDIQYRYYENNALYWAGKGVISGDGSGAFKGENPATRAETAKILCLVMGFSVSKTAGAEFYGTFKDVVKNAWYVGYLEALYQRGVMLGDGAGKIRPDAKISRQEMGTLICRAMGIEEDTAPLNSSKLKGIDKIASWARGSMGALIGMGALKGDNNGNINAENNIKRGELVTLMSNLVTLYIEDGGTYDLTGKSGIVIVKASPVTLNGTFDGNVIFAEGVANAKHTVNADVSGKVISYAEKAFITVNGNTACVDAEGKSSVVNLNAPTSYFQLGGDSSSANVGADVEEVAVTGSDCTVNITGVKAALVGIRGNNDTVTTLGVTDELVVAKGADGAKVNVQIGGEVKSAKVDGNNATLSGSGSLGSATVNGSYNAINTSNTNYYLGAAATNVTAGGKTVEPGTTGKTGGASVTVIGGGTSGSVAVTPQTIAPVITVQPQNIDEPLSFGSAYGKFSVEVKNESKHTYRYQWYLADSASYDDGVAIEGATDAEISVSKQTPVGTHYIYCKVTASMSGAVTTKETLSEFATFSVQPGTINVLLVGGQPELGTNKAMANALEKLYQEQGITPNIVNTVTMSTTDMRQYSIFSWASTAMKGSATGSTYSAIYNNIHTALAPDADVKYDYVIFALGRTWNLASRQVQSKTKERLSLIYFEKLVYDHNPDATMFVASTAGFNIKNISCVDSGRTYGVAPDRAAHMSAQNAQAQEFVDILNDNNVPLDVQHLELGYGGELATQAGVPTVDTTSYKNVTLNGALVYAMIIYAKTTGLSPLDVTLTKWDTNEVNVNDMPVLTSSAAEAVSKSDTEYTVTFDSVGGTPVEPVKGKYGDKVQKPASPTNGDYTFGGWYKDDVYMESFDFARDTIGLCGMTLYAKWLGTSTEEPVITAQPANTTIRYATSGSISVDNEAAPHHTYSYQC
ncbi:MAG: S-layer homology domain-containing protein, partial [Clostridia bacterium]|nr:S-layer homology domain-containing protein [Clostridia bacterium]